MRPVGPGRLTIAIPTYNRASLLKVALESALAQTSPDVRILVSDNGSSDGTAALLAAYDDPRLRKLRLETTIPRGDHGTFIFAQIETEFVTILSDDDWLEPTFAAEALALYDEHPELSFVYTGCIEHYDDVRLPALVGPRVESSLDFFAAHYAGQRQVSWCACALRIADIRACGPQPPDRLIGDMFFWCQIGFRGPVGCVGAALSNYSVLRPGGDNESRSVPTITWGREVRRLAGEVLAGATTAGLSAAQAESLARDMRRYTARSLANQFLWARISGARRSACWREIPKAAEFGGWEPQSLVRIGAAMILSRSRLRRTVLTGLRRLAATRSVVSAAATVGS